METESLRALFNFEDPQMETQKKRLRDRTPQNAGNAALKLS